MGEDTETGFKGRWCGGDRDLRSGCDTVRTQTRGWLLKCHFKFFKAWV